MRERVRHGIGTPAAVLERVLAEDRPGDEALPGREQRFGWEVLGLHTAIGKVVASSSIPSASPERIFPPRWHGPTPLPVNPRP